MSRRKAPAASHNPELAQALRDDAKCAKALYDACDGEKGTEFGRYEAEHRRSQAARDLARECLQRHMDRFPPPAESGLWHLADGLSMGLITDSFRRELLTWADAFDTPALLTATETKALAYISRNPGANAAAIAKHCGIEAAVFRNNVAPRLKALAGVTSRRGCTGGYWPPPRARK